jgi:hypothetical protein
MKVQNETSSPKERHPFSHQKDISVTAPGIITANALIINEEIQWLVKILDHRIAGLKNPFQSSLFFSEEAPPDLGEKESPYADLVNDMQLGPAERLLLITSLVPHISPDVLTEKIRDEQSSSLKILYPVLGGYFDPTFTSFVPTLQTILYLLADDDLNGMFFYQLFLLGEGKLLKEQIITLRAVSTSQDDDNIRNQALCLAPEYTDYLISGRKPRPDFGRAFPASLITTGHNWDQLVISDQVRNELNRIIRWAENGKALLEKTNNRLNGSFTCLFYGPSGSGKTLAAQLIGKSMDTDVFRIDLSMVVSKYIGETEKNLAYLFDRAKGKNWILFFDEADALFGKRTNISDSKDKWANLEMSYLLQRMEEHNGLTILASNFKNNIDNAMTRRFQSVVYFGRPEQEQRIDLWKKLLPAPFSYDPKTDFKKLAQFDMTGGNIINCIKAACLEAVHEGREIIDLGDLAEAIKREFAKENRTI